MFIRPASDRSLLISFGEQISLEAHHQVSSLTASLDGVRGILNLHPAFTSVLVDFDPRLHTHEEIESLVRERFASSREISREHSRIVKIPVTFGGAGGPDLEDVAGHTGLTPVRVVELFAAAEYEVYFVGFATCFPYLGGLPGELATPRLSAPRKLCPGRQCRHRRRAGRSLPAGLARRMAADRADRAASVRSGERAAALTADGRPGKIPGAMNHIRVISPGLQTTVQDLGRFGWAQFGISASGAADPIALRAGNLLVGNAENAAAIEMTLVGGAFEFEADAVIALTGSDFGAGRPLWTAIEIRAGETVCCGGTRSGARCYLSVRGGIGVRKVMGSASTHIMTGVGGRPLCAGDILPVGDGAIGRPRGSFQPALSGAGPLRVTAGPQADRFAGELYNAEYTVSEESNRMGLRLRGPAIPSPTGQMVTEGTPLGAIQVPPDGQPIILFVEHQTTGGYPKPANVITADFWRLGQLRPRDEVRFELVGLEVALALLQEQERQLYSLLRRPQA